MSFAERLAALMAEQGVSERALAKQVTCHRSYVHLLKTGQRRPGARIAQRLDGALNAGGELAALVPRKGPPRRSVLAGGMLAGAMLSVSPEARERLAWAVAHPPQIDAAAVESLSAVLSAQRVADDALGSAAMLQSGLAQMQTVEILLDQARGPLRPALVAVAMQQAQFTAWLFRDIGDQAGARIRCAQALEWAAELGDPTMTSTVLAERSYMAGEAGNVGAMIGLAQAAQRDITAAAGQRALAAGLEARGYAMTGDQAGAERKLGEARDLAAALAARPEDRRPWAYWMRPVFFRNEEGITCAYLAGTAPRWHDRAVALLGTVPGVLWATAANLTHLALAHARAGDVAEACATARKASGAVRQEGSARHAVMLASIHAGLYARYPRDGHVAELGEALRSRSAHQC